MDIVIYTSDPDCVRYEDLASIKRHVESLGFFVNDVRVEG